LTLLLLGGFGAVTWTAPAARTQSSHNPCGPNRIVPAQRIREPLRAAFDARSYFPGATARLRVTAKPGRLVEQIFQVGANPPARNAMTGAPVVPASELKWPAGGPGTVTIPIGSWPSGLFFARVSQGDSLAFAPFIVKSRPLGASRVAVVLPTNTWQAYNFRDSDHNGFGDTWYADPGVHSVDLTRPYLHHGVPSQLNGVMRWLASRGMHPDVFADDDLNVMTGAQLAHLYDLVVFAGHEEYVTQHAFSTIKRYRDLGGNLAFLSANNLYARVTVRAGRMRCLGHFRDIGEPEAAIAGVQYVNWFQGKYASRAFVVRSLAAAPWLFRGTGLRVGDRFGFSYGVEIDATAASSPSGTRVIGELPDIFGPGETAQMTYYQTARGAKVFAAGAMNFEAPQSPQTERMLGNLWAYLAHP
jgi:hypothetical protein